MNISKCPKCSKVFGKVNIEAAPGSFTMCVDCECLMVYKEDMSVRSATEEEEEFAETHSDLKEARRVAKKYRDIRKAKIGAKPWLN
jgi:hypothetical protein